MPTPTRATAQHLLDGGLRPKRSPEVLRETILEAYNKAFKETHSEAEALQRLYPNTLLDEATLRRVTSALVSGSNVLFVGPPGSGKTNLAKDIWELYPKSVFAVADCPVQDDPFSLIDAVFSQTVPPCPYCKIRYGDASQQGVGEFDPKKVDPKNIPVATLRLREGHGLARIQGSPEVFPDNLTGAINIAKLEEIGDPNSPLVMEPGKVLQANRGLLLIDEIGKLSRGTQNVLLQALQESIVTPAKSRETFPASFVAVATSNLQDLDNVAEPLIGRLGIVYIPFNEDHRKNVDIVSRGIVRDTVHTSLVFCDAAATLTESWRKTGAAGDDLSEVGSNRTMVDIVRRAQALALLAGRPSVEAKDFTQGAIEAMSGRIRARGSETFHQNYNVVQTFVQKRAEPSLREATYRYWCDFYIGILKEDKAEGLRTLDAVRADLDGRQGDPAKVARFREFIVGREGRDGKDPKELVRRVFKLLESTGAFEGEKKG